MVQDGKIVAIVGSLTDITERKQAEEALSESKQRMDLALQGADLGTWDWNVQTGHATFNERWAQMLGYTLDEIQPHVSVWERLIHPDDLVPVMEILNAHLEGRTDSYAAEHRLKHKSGDWVWVLDKGRVIDRDADGKPLRACGTHLDITERKQAEEALRVSEERFRTLFEAAPDAIYLTDLEGNLVDANKTAERLSGVPKDQAMGRSLLEWGLLSTQQMLRTTAPLKANAQGETTGPKEFTLRRPRRCLLNAGNKDLPHNHREPDPGAGNRPRYHGTQARGKAGSRTPRAPSPHLPFGHAGRNGLGLRARVKSAPVGHPELRQSPARDRRAADDG